MKISYSLLVVLSFVVVFTGRVHSQAPVAGQNSLAQTQALKASNLKLMERQAATLLKLAEIEKEAAQLKFLSKRS